MPYVSIIIPVYNAEKTIEKCLLSLYEQRDKSFEIIIYNDGSTDNSLSIINDTIKLFDVKITIVSSDNCGVSHARNRALELSNGEFVTFVDADDSVTSSFIHDFKISHDKFKADIYIGKIRTKNVRELSLSGYYDCSKMRSVIDTLDSSDYIGYLHNKFYRRSLINENVSFPQNLRMSEDLIFNMSYISSVNCCCIFDSFNYHYNDTDNSLSKKTSSLTEISERLVLLEEKYNLIEGTFPTSSREIHLVGKEKRLLTLKLQQWCATIFSQQVGVDYIYSLTDILRKIPITYEELRLMNRNEIIKLALVRMPFVKSLIYIIRRYF